jgi:RNA polymerase sigma-70 factor, ECF subfamily
MAEGPEAGLRLIDAVAVDLDEFHPLHAARADLLCRAGRRAEAVEAYARAIGLCANEVERRYLTRRLAEVSQY